MFALLLFCHGLILIILSYIKPIRDHYAPGQFGAAFECCNWPVIQTYLYLMKYPNDGISTKLFVVIIWWVAMLWTPEIFCQFAHVCQGPWYPTCLAQWVPRCMRMTTANWHQVAPVCHALYYYLVGSTDLHSMVSVWTSYRYQIIAFHRP